MTEPEGIMGKGARILIGDGLGGWDDIGAIPFPDADPVALGMDVGSKRDLSLTVRYRASSPDIVAIAYVSHPFAEAEEAVRNFVRAQRETVDAINVATNAVANYIGLLGRQARDLPEGTMTRQRRRAEARASRKGRRDA